ncbi:MAG: dephospho-CoA kinase [Bacteroidota bacterium]|nr:dephospho-CoA kinase [Bacteroidota bacterium]
MIIVGLTGGIGSGKSTVINHFKELGVNCYQADKEAKKLMDSDDELIKKIQNSFGDEIYSNSKLDRKKLASIVFRNKKKLDLLNSIVHPVVHKHFANYCERHNDIYIIKEVAIIFETGSQDKFDKIILVKAPKEERIKRIIIRDRFTRQDVLDRINNQKNDEGKIEHCDFIINNIDLEDLPKKVLEIHNTLLNCS